MDYRRAHVPGGLFFFTLVTHPRRALLINPSARTALRRAVQDVRRRHPFLLEAIVLLPDHLHMLMKLPEGDADFGVRVGGIKRRFTELYLAGGQEEASVSAGRFRKRYRGVWQARFWEHTIRDAKDFRLHLDYVHANPLKHELVARVGDWPWSSFHRYVRWGEYESDWAGRVTLPHDVEHFYAD